MEMNKLKFINHLEKHSNAIGLSGHEGPVAKLLMQTFKEQKLHVVRDGLGGIYASNVEIREEAKKPRVLIVAHMDEVGFIVKNILPNGLVKVGTIGGIVLDSLFGIRVCFFGKDGKYTGIFTAVPSHFAATNSIAADDISIDFGFESREEAIEHGLTEGTPIAFDTTFTPLGNENRFMGKAIDNRYGCAMVATLAETIFTNDFKNNDVEIVVGATVMEEIGLKGASAAVQITKPDFIILLDCSPAADTLPKDNTNGVLGNGVLYRYMDRTMVLGERLKRYMKILLDEHNIPYQPYISAGGTDAGRMLELGEGIPTITCCVPARYIHNSGAIIDVRDAAAAYQAIWQMATHYKNDIHRYLHFIDGE